MALPALVVSGGVIASTYANAIRNALANWSFTVDAGNNELRNVGMLSAASGAFIGNVSAAAISGTSLSASGTVAGAAGSFTGGLSAGALNITGAITGGNTAIFAGAINGASLAVGGAITGASVAATGAITGSTATFTGNVTAANFVFSGAVGGASATFSGLITCQGISNSGGYVFSGATLRYIECESQHLAFYKKSGGFSYYWRRSDTGRQDGANQAEMMSLDDLGNLTVNGNTLATTLLIRSPGSSDMGVRFIDAIRDWKMGINLGGTGVGRFTIFNVSVGRPLLMAGDDFLFIDCTGTGLRRLFIDANNFVKVF